VLGVGLAEVLGLLLDLWVMTLMDRSAPVPAVEGR
jgi:hypothetical protein